MSAQHKHRRAPERGFTFTELLVGTFLSAVISLSVFSIFINSSDFFGKQLDHSQVQSTLRFAMEYMKSDLRGLGRLSILNTDYRVRDSEYCGMRVFQGIELTDNDPGSEFYQVPPVLNDNDLTPDRLRLLVDASDATPLVVRSQIGATITLAPTLNQPTVEARRMTSIGAEQHFAYLFDERGLTRITNLTTGRYDIVPTGDARLVNGIGQITLSAPPCLDLNCASGQCVVNPIHWVEYAVLNRADHEEHTYLARRRLNLNTGAPLPNSELIIADYVIDFQLWGHYDTRGQAGNALGQLSSLLAPQLPDDDDPKDDRGNWEPGQSESDRMTLWGHRLRGLDVMLAVRTAKVDPHLTIDLQLPGMSAQERSTIRLQRSPGQGRAPVRTLIGVIDIQNVYRGE